MDSPKQIAHNLDFNNLVKSYYTPLFRFAYSLAGNEEDACDLTQQTFYIWATKGSSLRDASKVKSWLFTSLYREFLRVRRRGRNMISYEPELLETELPPVTPDYVTTLDAAGAVESLAEVDEIYRAPITLFYLEDLSYKEIAAALELPIGTVMSRLSRGKAQLREILVRKEKGTRSPASLEESGNSKI